MHLAVQTPEVQLLLLLGDFKLAVRQPNKNGIKHNINPTRPICNCF